MKIDKFLLKGYPNNEAPQKRFLVSFNNLDALKRLPDCQIVLMTDCQEMADEVHEIRTRKVETEGEEQYFRSIKTIEFGKEIDCKEEPISKEEYLKSEENMYHLFRLLPRTRYAFSNGIISSAKLAREPLESDEGRGIFMMFDTFNLWHGFGILTVKGEQAASLGEFKLPCGLEIVKEITKDKTYTTKVISTIDYTSFLE